MTHDALLVLLALVFLALFVFYVLGKSARRLVPMVVGATIGAAAVVALISWHPATPSWPRPVDSGVRSITICGKDHAHVMDDLAAHIPGVREGTWGPPVKRDGCYVWDHHVP